MHAFPRADRQTRPNRGNRIMRAVPRVMCLGFAVLVAVATRKQSTPLRPRSGRDLGNLISAKGSAWNRAFLTLTDSWRRRMPISWTSCSSTCLSSAGTCPIRIVHVRMSVFEEHAVVVRRNRIEVTAADTEGIRRGLVDLEDMILSRAHYARESVRLHSSGQLRLVDSGMRKQGEMEAQNTRS